MILYDIQHVAQMQRLSHENNFKEFKFPRPNDPIWTTINHELEAALPLVFSDHKINCTPMEKPSRAFDKWLYDFFAERFDIVDPIRNTLHPKRENMRCNYSVPARRIQNEPIVQ